MITVTKKNKYDTDTIVEKLIAENIQLKRKLSASDQVEIMNNQLIDSLMAHIERLEHQLGTVECLPETGDTCGRFRQPVCRSCT